jgi:hypothetical protein
VPLIILFTRLAKWKMKEEESTEVSRGDNKAQAAEASKAEEVFFIYTLLLNYIKNEHFLNSLRGATRETISSLHSTP